MTMVARCLTTLGLLLALGGPAAAQPRLDALGDPLPPGAVARLGTLRLQHPVGDPVVAVAYSGDGKVLASRGRKSGLRVWDAATGKELHRLDVAPEVGPHTIAVSADGAALAIANDKDVLLWTAGAGGLVATLRGPGARVLAVALADSDRTVVAVAADGTVRWWERATGKLTRELTLPGDKGKPPANLLTAMFAPGATALAVQSGGYDRRDLGPDEEDPPGDKSETLVYDLAAGKLTWRGRATSWQRTCLAFSSDGKRFALAVPYWGLDPEWLLGVRYTATGLLASSAQLPGYQGRGSRDQVAALAFAPDGNTVAAARGGWSLVQWHLATDSLLSRAPATGPQDLSPRCLAYSPDGKTLIVGVDHVLHVHTTAALQPGPPAARLGPVRELLFTGGKLVMRCDSDRYYLDTTAWEIGTWKRLGPNRPGKSDLYVSGDPDGRGDLFAGPDADGWGLFDPRTGKLLGHLEGRTRAEDRGLASGFSPRGTIYWRGFPDKDALPIMDFFAVPSGKFLCREPWGGGGAWAFSADEKYLAAGNAYSGKVYVIELATGKEHLPSAAWAKAAVCKGGGLAVFSPDGRLLAAWGKEGREVIIWDLQTGKERSRVRCPPARGDYPPAVCLAFSPDGKTLAAGGVEGDTTVRLFEMETGKPRATLQGHQGLVQCLTYSPDGRWLLSGSADRTVLVWDVSGKLGF